jgi:heme exporter protein B
MTNPGMSNALLALFQRDLKLAVRNRSETAAPILFLLMVTTLFPLGLGPDSSQLAAIAPGVIWVGALLASMLSLNHLFSADFRDGTLEQMVMSPWPLSAVVTVKVLVHWLVSGLPLAIIAPLIGLSYNLPASALQTMLVSLLLGTPILSLIGAIGVALSVGLHRGGMFLSLLVLPLFVPVLIFATAAIVASVDGLPVASHLYLLGAMLALAVTLAPFGIASALRISLS